MKCRRTVKIEVGEKFLFAPHCRLDAFGDGIKSRVVTGRGKLSRPLLDNGAARVGRFIDAMAKAHDQLLVVQHLHQTFFRLLGCFETLDQAHRLFICAAMQRPAQRPNTGGYRRMKISQRRGRNPRSESRSVELVLGIKNKANVERARVKLRRHFAMQ